MSVVFGITPHVACTDAENKGTQVFSSSIVDRYASRAMQYEFLARSTTGSPTYAPRGAVCIVSRKVHSFTPHPHRDYLKDR